MAQGVEISGLRNQSPLITANFPGSCARKCAGTTECLDFVIASFLLFGLDTFQHLIPW